MYHASELAMRAAIACVEAALGNADATKAELIAAMKGVNAARAERSVHVGSISRCDRTAETDCDRKAADVCESEGNTSPRVLRRTGAPLLRRSHSDRCLLGDKESWNWVDADRWRR